jgi:glutathione S-transferase
MPRRPSLSKLPGIDNPMPPQTMDQARSAAPMRLYHHPISTTSRPILMFAAEHGLALDGRVVDIFAGEQAGAQFSALNANQQVPVLVDGDFCLTESSAILKYLADKLESPAYPQALRERARVNAAMDWVNTGLMRELAYGFAYPQLMPNHRRPSALAQAAVLAWAGPRAARCLDVMDGAMLGDGRRFLTGERISLADYLALAVLTVGEVVGQDYARWPRLQQWLAHMKARPSFARSHDPFLSFAAQVRTPSFVAL